MQPRAEIKNRKGDRCWRLGYEILLKIFNMGITACVLYLNAMLRQETEKIHLWVFTDTAEPDKQQDDVVDEANQGPYSEQQEGQHPLTDRQTELL